MTQECEVLVIGGGPGGTPAAMALASAGRQVVLVEKGEGLGGTCLFEGCIPSKIIRESARRLREIREAGDFGLCLPSMDVGVNWSAIMQRKRKILQQRSDGARQTAGQIPTLDIRFGEVSLTSARTADIVLPGGDVESIHFEQAIIATGSTPTRPPIRGVEHRCVLDSESILDIDHIPQKLVIIGGGPIGVELGQVFNTFGSEVCILELAENILRPVDTELAVKLQAQMVTDGIEVLTGTSAIEIVHTGKGAFVNFKDSQGKQQHRITEKVLLVTGRHPNVEGLGLENTAVEHNAHGITVDAQLQTGEAGIYALGDVIGNPMFAHWATAQGLALARHLLGQPVDFPREQTNSAVIFSEPELAMAGMTEQQATAAGIDYAVARYDFARDARAQIQGRASGLLKILYEAGSHKIIGVHALVEGADDIMGEAALLVKAGLPIELLAPTIHPHPTLTESFALAARAALASQTGR